MNHKTIRGLKKIKNDFKQKIKEKDKNIINQEFLCKGLFFFPFNDEKIDKIIKRLNEKYCDLKISKFKVLENHPFCKINPQGTTVDITCSGVSKGQALADLCKMWNINSQQVLACGDEMNDKTMLEFAEYSIAMENANPKLKKLAKFVTEDNDNSGVAKAIERLIFSQDQKQDDKNYDFNEIKSINLEHSQPSTSGRQSSSNKSQKI